MAKHDRARTEKVERNLLYALRFRQRRCEKCGHKSSRTTPCAVCGGRMK